MKSYFYAFLVLVSVLVFTSSNAQAQAGILDSTYGYNGRGYFSIGSDNPLTGAVMQPDQKVIMVGGKYAGPTSQFVVTRTTVQGFPDTSFSVDGRMEFNVFDTSVNAYSLAYDVVVQPDGKIVIAGYTYYHTALVRLKPNGDFDSTFGIGGVVLTPAAEQFHHANQVLLQPDGKIIVVGDDDIAGLRVMLHRYFANGNLDPSFGNGGIVHTALNGSYNDLGHTAVLQADGKIVVGGSTYNMTDGSRALLLRYNSSGTLDTSFGIGGITVTQINPDNDEIFSLALLPDGKILTGGYTDMDSANTTNFNSLLMRFKPDGAVDSSFGMNGVQIISLATGDDIIRDLNILPDGKLLVAGYGFGMARLLSNGLPDAAYGLGGIAWPKIISFGAIKAMPLNNGPHVMAGVYNYGYITGRYKGDAPVCATATSGVAVSSVTATTATVTWNASASAIKYRVRLKNIATGVVSLSVVNAPTLTKLLTGLTPGTPYQVKVRSQCSATGTVLSPWSNVITFTTPAGGAPCAPPASVSIAPTAVGSAWIQWTPAAGASGYQLRYRQAGTSIWTLIIINNGTTASQSISGLTPGLSYDVQLRTKCSVSPLVWSNYTSVSTFTAVRIGEEEVVGFTLFPNPSSGNITINSNGLVGTVSVYDVTGKEVLTRNFTAQERSAVIEDLPSGIYVCCMINDSSVVAKRFVIARR